MISFKLAVNLFGVIFLSGTSYVAISLMASDQDVNSDMVGNSSHLHDYSNTKNVSGKSRSYLSHNVFSFYWGCADASIKTIANGFLLNILSNEKISRKNTITWNSQSNKVQLLIGTSLSFASKMFDEVSDFSTDVNYAATAPNLSTKSTKKDYKFQISQPDFFKDKSHEGQVKPVNFLKSKDATVSFDGSYYINVEPTDVELVYAAAGLHISDDAMRLNSSNPFWGAGFSPHELRSQTNNNIVWHDKVVGYDHQFAVDFAVLKVSVPIYQFDNKYLGYLKALDAGSLMLNSTFIEGIYDGVNNKRKVDSILLSGFSNTKEDQQEVLKLDDLAFSLNIKDTQKSDIRSKTTSQVKGENKYDDYFELKFFEGVDNTKESPASSYKFEVIEAQALDTGELYLRYKLKKDSKIIDKEFVSVFSGFKRNSTTALTPHISVNSQVTNLEEKTKYNNFAQEPIPLAQSNEFYLQGNYSEYDNFYSMHASRASKSASSELDLNNSSDVFEIKSKKYVNVAHRVTYRDPMSCVDSTNNFKGALALAYGWQKDGKDHVLGIYEGNKNISNVFGAQNCVGNISLLVSPLYYNLIGQNNNFSKPSLMDSLAKKNNSQKKLLWPKHFIT